MNVVYNITSRNAGTSATESRVWHCVDYNLNLDNLKQNCETAKMLFKDVEDIFSLYKNLMIFLMYDLLKFVKICLTIGCVNTSCERSSSTLKRVKPLTYCQKFYG